VQRPSMLVDKAFTSMPIVGKLGSEPAFGLSIALNFNSSYPPVQINSFCV